MSLIDQHRHSSNTIRPIVEVPYTLIACVNQQNELLMVKRNKPPFVGHWNFIGGKINLGETPIAAAIREIREEANRDPALTRVNFKGIACWPNPSNAGKYLGMYLFFLGCRTGRIPTRQLGLLHEGITAWINIDLLSRPSEFIPVPNFDLILPLLMANGRAPHITCHEVNDDGVRELWSFPIAQECQSIANRPHSTHILNVSNLLSGA